MCTWNLSPGSAGFTANDEAFPSPGSPATSAPAGAMPLVSILPRTTSPRSGFAGSVTLAPSIGTVPYASRSLVSARPSPSSPTSAEQVPVSSANPGDPPLQPPTVVPISARGAPPSTLLLIPPPPRTSMSTLTSPGRTRTSPSQRTSSPSTRPATAYVEWLQTGVVCPPLVLRHPPSLRAAPHPRC